MKKTICMALALALILGVVGVIHAEGEITLVSDKVTAKFQQNMTFSLEARGSVSDINSVTLYYQVGNQPVTSYAYPKFEAGRAIKAEYVWDTKKSYIPPGVTINYYYLLEDAASNQLKTARKSFLYTDTRHTWKNKTTGNLTLNWYQGSDSFGNDLFEAAKTALAQLENDAGVRVQQPVSLWIYESYEELRSSMEQGAKEWTGGVSYSDMGVILIGVAESNLAWGKRAVAHELSHVVIDQATHNPFGELPRWLNEGLAMYSEGPLESSYKTSLDRAVSQGKLLTLKTISSNFPADANQATLSYAESYSVLKYLIDTFGRDKMSALLNVFKDGATYDGALKTVYGMDTDGLDAAWQGSLGIKPAAASATPAPRTSPTAGRPVPLPATATPTPGVLEPPGGGLPADLGVLIFGLCAGCGCVSVAVVVLVVVTWLAKRRR
jgi:hypothetical protein